MSNEPIEVALNIQLSPCKAKMNEAATIEAFNQVLEEFVGAAMEEEGLHASISAAIESQSIISQNDAWSRFLKFYRKVYTKRRNGDPVGDSRVEVEEVLTLSVPTNTDEERLSDIVIKSFQQETSSDHLVDRFLSSPDTSPFFTNPESLQVVAVKQNRYAGLRVGPVVGSIGALLAVILFIRFRPKRRTRVSNKSTPTSQASSSLPEVIDISNNFSSISRASPATVYVASQEAERERKVRPAMSPVTGERHHDIEEGLSGYHSISRRQSRKHSQNDTSAAEAHALTVVVPAGYPEELGFSVKRGHDALEVEEVLEKLPLGNVLHIGDKIARIDGEDATRWREGYFEEYLIERRRHNKTLLLVRRSDNDDGTHDDASQTYYSEDEYDDDDDDNDDSTYYQ